MLPFTYSRPRNIGEAATAGAQPGTEFIAGGTDLLPLLKEGVRRANRLVDINDLPLGGIRHEAAGVRLGALTRMSDAADDERLRRDYPAVVEALLAGASPQLRNLATVGGNLLQHTRCLYFHDAAMPCNKRQPGSGCPAWDGQNRGNAILGGSRACIATHASDLAVALVALEARVVLGARHGEREVPLADFHRLPGDTPQIETVLEPGEVITAIFVPAAPYSRRSTYVKLRDRASFEWALTSAAAALDLAGDTIRQARVAVGGVATKPWRLPKVEEALAGARADRSIFHAAAELAAQGAEPRQFNAFKVELMKRAIVRALADAGSLA